MILFLKYQKCCRLSCCCCSNCCCCCCCCWYLDLEEVFVWKMRWFQKVLAVRGQCIKEQRITPNSKGDPVMAEGETCFREGEEIFFFKKWAIPGLFLFIFVFSIQLVIYKLTNECSIKFCRWLESNRGPLVSKATALPTEPQPLPGGRNHLMDKTLMSKTKAIVINGI